MAAGPFAAGDLAGRLRFSASHVVMIALCLMAVYFGLESTRRVINVHRGGARLLLTSCVLGAIVLFAALFGPFGDFVARTTLPFFDGLAHRIGYCDAKPLETALAWQGGFGVFFLCLAVVSLTAAAATIAYRFEHDDINGIWSDSHVLREKLNALLTLLFIAAALLVVSNIALGALLDTAMQIGGAAKGAADLMKDTDAFLKDDAAQAAANHPVAQAEIATAQLAALKPLVASISAFCGAISSLLLIAMFVPSFMVLIDDIGIAGKTHAAYDMHDGTQYAYVADLDWSGVGTKAHITGAVTQPDIADLATPYRVAGWKTVNEWKAKHGLAMSVTDLTASFIAVAAPLLSSSLVDLSKAVVGGH